MSRQKLRSVLYVDDDPDIREVVQSTLCLISGLDVHTAESGLLAIDLAYRLRPDLLLMDVMMPGLDGPSTYLRMRESPLVKHIPVVFLTAKVLPAEVAHFLRLGAIGVIGKPFDPLKLGAELMALWDRSAVARVMTEPADPAAAGQKADSFSDRFIGRTQRDVARLLALCAQARRGDRPALEEIAHVTHSIHGAGAMFGFAALSASGGHASRAVEALMHASEAGTAGAELSALHQRMADCIDRLAEEATSAAAAAGDKHAAQGVMQARE